MMDFDGKFFQKRLKDISRTQKDCAAALDTDPVLMTRIMQGKQPLKLSQIEPFAKFLDLSVPVVLTRAGVDMSQYVRFENSIRNENIHVTHYYKEGKIFVDDNSKTQSVSCPADLPADAKALRIDQAGLLQGSYLIYAPRDIIDPNGIGRMSVIETSEGRIEIGHILPSPTLDHYLITTHAGEKINTTVKRVSPSLHIKI